MARFEFGFFNTKSGEINCTHYRWYPDRTNLLIGVMNVLVEIHNHNEPEYEKFGYKLLYW